MTFSGIVLRKSLTENMADDEDVEKKSTIASEIDFYLKNE